MEHSKSRNSSGGRKPQPLRRSSIDIRAGQDLDLPKTPATLEIHLNEKEKRICDLLLDVADHLKEEHPDLPPVTLRIAGGWVRDKLLGIDSHDIDVAIDTMKGFDFAEHVNAYLEKKGFETKHIAKITANPDKSKHLETATSRIFDHDVDFVNLRSETYTEHSRVPIIDHATPEEDAMRRDITINALFFNIHTRQIEDLTGKGLSDLAQGIVRTPLPAIQTFLDDPLRVLRVVRFASRFHYTLSEDIPEAIKDESIRKALKVKISKERIGEELRKMLRSQHPLRAIRFFHQLDLYPIIFVPPSTLKDPDPESGLLASEYLYTFLSSRVSLPEHLHKIRASINEAEKAHLFLAADLLPFKSLIYLEKKKEVPVTRYIIKDSLKLSNSEADFACALLNDLDSIAEVVQAVANGRESRVQIGLLIRQTGARPLLDRWSTAVLMGMVAEVVRLHPAGEEDFDFAIPVLEKYDKFFGVVEKLQLKNAWDLKPILDGGQVLSTLKIKAGPELKNILDELINWQLENPTESADNAKTWLVERFGKKST